MRYSLPAGATEAYEALRLRAIQPDRGGEYAEGRGVLLRCGLAQWALGQSSAITFTSICSHLWQINHPTEIPATVEPELVKLVAGLILSRRQEGVHA